MYVCVCVKKEGGKHLSIIHQLIKYNTSHIASLCFFSFTYMEKDHHSQSKHSVLLSSFFNLLLNEWTFLATTIHTTIINFCNLFLLYPSTRYLLYCFFFFYYSWRCHVYRYLDLLIAYFLIMVSYSQLLLNIIALVFVRTHGFWRLIWVQNLDLLASHRLSVKSIIKHHHIVWIVISFYSLLVKFAKIT